LPFVFPEMFAAADLKLKLPLRQRLQSVDGRPTHQSPALSL
jgi:hypothetical protein